jgi:hypothetical protein
MVTISLDSPSCEVTLFDPVLVVYQDATRQAKGLYRLKYVGALWSGLAYLSRYNSSWYCHNGTLILILRFNLRLGGYSIWSAIFQIAHHAKNKIRSMSTS